MALWDGWSFLWSESRRVGESGMSRAGQRGQREGGGGGGGVRRGRGIHAHFKMCKYISSTYLCSVIIDTWRQWGEMYVTAWSASSSKRMLNQCWNLYDLTRSLIDSCIARNEQRMWSISQDLLVVVLPLNNWKYNVKKKISNASLETNKILHEKWNTIYIYM